MKELKDRVALVTGASRGIGRYIAEALAREGVHLIIAARDGDALDSLAGVLRSRYKVQILPVATDLAQRAQIDQLLERSKAVFNEIDILVNNAALERSEHFWESDPHQTALDLEVNVHAPLYLSRRLLPGMLWRNRGHIVNLASLAGLGANAYGESYITSKHAIVGFTRALRASLAAQGSSVSASSVCPGFVTDVGMFARKQAANGVDAPGLLGSSTPTSVARAVIKAIRTDKAELIVNPMPVRPLLVIALLWPALGAWLSRISGLNRLSAQMVEASQKHP